MEDERMLLRKLTPSKLGAAPGAHLIPRSGWAIWLHKDILELGTHPQSDAICPAEPCLGDVLTARATRGDVHRGEFLEEVAVLTDRVRNIERGVWKARKQAWKRATCCIPIAIDAGDVPIGEFALQLGGPALSLDPNSSVHNGSVDCVDV